MTAVTQTETAFRTALLAPDMASPEGLTDAKGQPAGRRFDVYRNNVAVSLRDALETGFPAVRALIGTESFAQIARGFIRLSPPRSPVLALYGEGFPAFIDTIKPLKHIGYLSDVARFELAVRSSYHAADTAPFALPRLAPESLATARLTLAPAVRILQSNWPVLSIHRYTLQPGSPKPAARAEDVLITRPEFDPSPHLLPPGAAAQILALQKGATMQDAAARSEADFTETLTLLAASGAIGSIDT
ncbi:DNA-binding domain-containing protein [Tropicibacter naphthalenivorans]|uniref:Putative DNA-binding domain-containing protein n=1 Tax=Tropicibacter naphthalenivorans TaxID=441103 RepID=A0A0P1G2K9_9RHOB|nr:DNA-binding domain-containing protein [Tropicibacter naphthalenivorans]CUH76043.1 hypothetical protein TRN7648_00752 [Tropicibacter naphthalenivorans]SMC40361.1 Putative DNA-binding domain-containing protein [Tropicibacter naphthalenivorans]